MTQWPHHNPRDARGYRVPREGTKSRRIYDAIIVQGRPQAEVAAEMGMKYATVGVHVWRIRNPQAANAEFRQRYALNLVRPS